MIIIWNSKAESVVAVTLILWRLVGLLEISAISYISNDSLNIKYEQYWISINLNENYQNILLCPVEIK